MSAFAGLLCFKFIPFAFASPCALAVGWWTYRLLPRLQSEAQHESRHRGRIELPLALDVLALGLDAGLSWDRATSFAATCCGGTLQSDFAIAAGRLAMGAAADEVWVGSSVLSEVGEVVDRSFRSGGTVSVLLRQHSDSLRAAERLRRIEKSRRLGTSILMPLTFIGVPAFLVIAIVPILVSSISMSIVQLV